MKHQPKERTPADWHITEVILIAHLNIMSSNVLTHTHTTHQEVAVMLEMDAVHGSSIIQQSIGVKRAIGKALAPYVVASNAATLDTF